MANAKKIDKTTLEYLGTEYQENLVKYFIEERNFFAKLCDIINPNVFTDDVLRRIVKTLQERYVKNEVVSRYSDLEIIFRSEISNKIELDKILNKLEQLKKLDCLGIDLVRDNAENFFKQQNITKAINKISEIIEKGDYNSYNDCVDIMRDAIEKGNIGKDEYFHPFDDMALTLSEEYRTTITTGCVELDDMLNGGIAKGELGLIIAPSNVGKTSSTTGFVAAAAIAGFKVLHIFFEDRDVDIKRKYFAYVTEIESYLLSRRSERQQAIDYFNTEKGAREKGLIQQNVYCYHGATGDVSANQIRNKINNLNALGVKIDMVVIDYFEAMKMNKPEANSDSEWTREGATMRSLEQIVAEFQVAMWVPVQGSKDSFDKDYVSMSQAGGSVKKVQIGHIVLAMARTQDQKEENKLNLFLHKFRGGKIKHGGQMLDITFNNGTCHFDMSTAKMTNECLEGDNQTDAYKMAQETFNETKTR